MTKLYEGMFLFDSNLASRDWPGLERHVRDILEKNSGELVYSERWPDRKLTYEIKGCKKGTYYLTYFKAPPTAVQGLTRDCELSERILRLLVLHDEILEEDCQKRVNREVTGSPEEIEDRKERIRREAQGIGSGAEAPSPVEGTSSPPGAVEGPRPRGDLDAPPRGPRGDGGRAGGEARVERRDGEAPPRSPPGNEEGGNG